MEVAISNTPFQTQVHEWQQHHPSPVAEAHPIENHWIKGSFNTYGKMVTNNFSTPDGTKHTQKKQMEILQARTKEGGALQVVKSSTSQSSSSRSVASSSGCDNSNTDRPDRPTSLSLSNMTRPLSSGFSRFNTSSAENGWDGSSTRGKSQSNEDLVGKHDADDSDYEMNQAWNRISRIRRSFQYPSPSSSTPKTYVRPIDFPSRASVDMNKIRQELESICGGNKNNKSPSEDDGEYVALDSILKGAAIEKPDMKKKKIVTSETLLNIRNSLRRLEDDSLYKDSVLSSPRQSFTVEDDSTKISYSSASPSVRSSFGDWRSKLLNKDSALVNSVLRRKSYGFEHLEDDKMESSTDSGLGGSSPTADRKRNSLLAISKSKLSPTRITLFNDSHLISLPNKTTRQSLPASLPTGTRFDFDGRTSILINGNTEDECSSQDGILDENGKKSTKRVEFCKTEIHFTPDSGRVNIVETDEKPPPTNNFRRRRRTSGSSTTSSSTTTTSATSVTDSMQYSRFKEKDEIQVAPDLILNKSMHGTVDLSPLNNYMDSVDDMAIRGILKNKPVKPKQYHLGENLKDIGSMWGVKLNPIYTEEPTYKTQEAITSNKTMESTDFGYSTKIDFTFKNDSDIWNEGAPAKNVLSRSYNSSFVEYKKPTSPGQSTGVLGPEQELKSISLVKNTIRLGDSPSKFEIMETEIAKPHVDDSRSSKYEFERLSSVRSSGFAPIVSQMSSQNEHSVNENQLKRDLDEAFKDLMNVSATLREMGKSTEAVSSKNRQVNPIKQHNTFPSIRSQSNSNASHSISTIASNNWSSYSRKSQKYESLSDFGGDAQSSSTSLKMKPIPKPRHSIGKLSVSPSPEKVVHAPLVTEPLEISGQDTVDILRQKNVVKTIQRQFEALSFHHQKTVIPDSTSELTHSNSNKLSIELYSPTNSIDRKDQGKEREKPKKRPVPVPRTIMSDSEGVVKPSRIVAKSKAFEQLAFKTGARQLKPTELVYFGILATNDSSSNFQSSRSNLNSSPNSPLLTRGRHSFTTPTRPAESYHAPPTQPRIQQRSSLGDVSPVNDYFYKTSFERKPSDDTDRRHSDTNDETFEGNTSTIERINKFERTIRENLIGTKSLEKQVLKSPKTRTRNEMLGYGLKETSVDDDLSQYDRSHDYKRDEKALAELTRAADEIMDTVKKMDEEENRRKSRSHHRHQQYMEVMDTINEKPSQAERRSSERVIYSPRRISRDCCSSLSSASSQESIPSLRQSPGRQQINRIPLRRNSSESIPIQASLKQSSKTSTNSTRDCRRMLRTASREVVNSSSEDLATPPVKVDPPRRIRRIKVVAEGVPETTTRESTRESSKSKQRPLSSTSSTRRQKPQEEKTASQRGKVYTHRLKKVDDISIKPSSSARRHTSTKSRAQSSTIRSSKTSL